MQKVIADTILSQNELLDLVKRNGGTDLILSDQMILYIIVPFINEEVSNKDQYYAIGTILVEVREGVLEIPYFSIDDSGLLHLDTEQTKLVSKERLNDIKDEFESDLDLLNKLIKRTK